MDSLVKQVKLITITTPPPAVAITPHTNKIGREREKSVANQNCKQSSNEWVSVLIRLGAYIYMYVYTCSSISKNRTLKWYSLLTLCYFEDVLVTCLVGVIVSFLFFSFHFIRNARNCRRLKERHHSN